jgi:carbon starvation protein
VTLAPMVWLVAITMTASYQKIFSANVRIGFLSQANALAAQISSGAIPGDKIAVTQRLIFNNRLDAAVTAVLAVMILVLLVEAIGEWIAILSGRKAAVLHESPFVATKWAEGGD